MIIQVQTAGRDGMLEKSASIYSNDPNQLVTVITVKAQVKPVIILRPHMLTLIGLQGQNVDGEVEIKANLDKPLTLEAGAFDLTGKMSYSLIEKEKGKTFVVRFKSTRPLAGALDGFLNLHTNYPEKPEIHIFIHCSLVTKNG